MASPAPSNFLREWRYTLNRQPVGLIEITLTDPSSRTLYLAEDIITTPDDRWWEPVCMIDPIEWRGSFLESGFSPVTASFEIANVQLAYQVAGQNAARAFKDYRWIGATVAIYFWDRALTNFADKFQVFKGVVADYQVSRRAVTIECIQRSDWNRVVTPTYCNRKDHPRATDKAIGQPIPIVLGDGSSEPMRGDWKYVQGTDRNGLDQGGGSIPATRCLLVDPGKGGAAAVKAKILVSGHAMKDVWAEDSGCNLYIRGEADRPNTLTIPGGDVFNGAAESGFYLDDANGLGRAWLPPIDAPSVSNWAENPRNLLDSSKEYVYTRLNWDNSERAVRINFGAYEPRGTITDVEFVVGYRMNHTTASVHRLTMFAGANGTIYDPTASTTPKVERSGSIGSLAWIQGVGDWDFSNMYLESTYIGGPWAGKEMLIYFAFLRVKYRPKQLELKPAKYEVRRVNVGRNRRWGSVGTGHQLPFAGDLSIHVPQLVEPAIKELEGDFYANPRGKKDDGSGTDTGVADAVIERAPDLGRHILRSYLGESDGNIVTAGSTFGSFVDARAKLKHFANGDMRYFRAITEAENGAAVLGELARDSVSWFYLSRFTDKWHWVPWETSPSVNYDYTFEPEDMIGDEMIEVSTLGIGKTLTGLRIAYLWDAARRQMAGDCSIGDARSQAGFLFLDLRDQYITVVTGVNDKLNWNDGASRTCTLTAGDYTPIGLAQHVATQMNAVSNNFKVAWGATIVAGYNDKIDFSDGSVKVATIAAGAYASMEALATAVATALNAGSSGWSCAFSHLTRALTISKSSGTAQLLWNTGANKANGAATTLGYYAGADDTGLLVYFADYKREEERFAIGSRSGVIDLLWETGTNGLNGTKTSCAELLGFLALRDQTGGQSSFVGDCPKGNLEQAILRAKGRYGGKRELTIESRWIRDSYTAREVRTRLARLLAEPPLVLSFTSTKAVELERGRVIQLSSAFDTQWGAYPKEGSDGSWAGKRFWAVSGRQHAGRSGRWGNEVLCVEANAAVA